MPCLLIQNKIDLIDTDQLPYDSKLSEFAKKNKFIQGIRTSVKEGSGLNEAMNCLIQNIVQRLEDYSKMTSTTLTDEGRRSNFSSLREKALFNPEENSRCC